MSVINNDRREIFLKFKFKISIVVLFAGRHSKWVACIIDYVDALSQRQKPQMMLILYHVE